MVRAYRVTLKITLEINECSSERAEARARGIVVRQGFRPHPGGVVKRVDQMEVARVREDETE